MNIKPTCVYCKKEIKDLWRYDCKVIRCPHCGKQIRVNSITYYFTTKHSNLLPYEQVVEYKEEPDKIPLATMPPDNKDWYEFYITNDCDIHALKYLMGTKCKYYLENGVSKLFREGLSLNTQKDLKNFFKHYQIDHLDIDKDFTVTINPACDVIRFTKKKGIR